MKLVFIAPVLEPFFESEPAATLGHLVETFVRMSHDVTVVMPAPPGLRERGFSLARRLTPIECTLNGEVHSYIRYETRINGGVEAVLLEYNGDSGTSSVQLPFGVAASRLVDTLGDLDGCVVVDGIEGIEVSGDLSRMALYVDTVPSPEALDAGEERFLLGEHLLQRAGANSGVLAEAVASGAVSIWPLFSRTDRPAVHKLSAKATVQVNLGLPVVNAPLLLLDRPSADVLSAMETVLRQKVQLVVRTDDADTVTPLQENYPDRLVVLSLDAMIDGVLDAADFSLVGDGDPVQVADCLRRGVVPVADETRRGVLRDLEVTGASGSGILFGGQTGRTVGGALLAAVALYYRCDDFSALSTRLTRLATDAEKTAQAILSVLGCAV